MRLFLVAAAADFIAVFVHGVLGYRAMVAPLIPDRLFATRGTVALVGGLG